MNKLISVVGLVGIIFCCLFFTSNIFASENIANFTVNVEQSIYQVDKRKTYFDLLLPKNQLIPLTIHVTNNSNQSIDIEGEVNNATTNMNGVVEYGHSSNKLTGKEPFNLRQVATFERSKQTITPKETVDFIINVKVPEKDYGGVVAGGITLRDATEKQDDKSNSNMFKNKFAYAIALILHGDKSTEKTKLLLKNIIPTQVNERNILSAALMNDSTNYVNKVSINAKVIDFNKQEVLSEKKENMQIAPNSIFQFPLYYKEKKMKAGTYILQMDVNSNNQKWHLSKSFVVPESASEKLNKTDVIINKGQALDKINYLILGLSLLIVFLVIVIAVLLKKKK
ncbi:DUF916 and DUF3324 domain-containing protein [Enterococcus faecalis]|uniref:DUF916 and DUF3324 domain-containing protein n=1 Tax=Enterococcus faecalis TaxID=1351 RepID=UPI0013869066|nr:DUF916 and DUF3324 domain-containing protein [Enterococcus faecalis]MEB7428320.1 DUF916 and DUF3324 domain-containing protein [Enterococcus faecalis]